MASFRLNDVTDRLGDVLPAVAVGAANAYGQQKAIGAAAGTKPTTSRWVWDAALAFVAPAVVKGTWGNVLGVAGGLGLGEDALGFAQSKGYLAANVRTSANAVRAARAHLVQPVPPQAGGYAAPFQLMAAEEVA